MLGVQIPMTWLMLGYPRLVDGVGMDTDTFGVMYILPMFSLFHPSWGGLLLAWTWMLLALRDEYDGFQLLVFLAYSFPTGLFPVTLFPTILLHCCFHFLGVGIECGWCLGTSVKTEIVAYLHFQSLCYSSVCIVKNPIIDACNQDHLHYHYDHCYHHFT